MIKTAITISLVPEARQGPFVFHGDLAGSVKKAAGLGFDAVEVFPPSAAGLDAGAVRKLVADHGVRVAAVGTGAGWVVEKLSLVDPDAGVRRRAVAFVRGIVDVAGGLGAPAIVGSMQGRHPDGGREGTLDLLADSLAEVAGHAEQYGVPVLYEPLNRYETNVFNRQGDAADWIRARGLANVKVLSDLFHMNIEEVDVAGALRRVGGELLGHVHFVDSTRRAAGWGHTDFAPVVAALREIDYAGYASAECFPIPDSDAAARQTIEAYKTLFG